LPKEFVMQTFTLAPQRWWLMRVFGRNPLVRLSDRVGVLLVLLASVASMIAAPVAGAVGTAVYDAHSLRYAEQAQTRHPVTATVLKDSSVILDTVTYTVSARWRADATEHTGSLSWPHFVKAGGRYRHLGGRRRKSGERAGRGFACRCRWRDGRDHDLAQCGRSGGGADRSGAAATEPSPRC
jgi:hypothetical protein